jgi:hypothetical protein
MRIERLTCRPLSILSQLQPFYLSIGPMYGVLQNVHGGTVCPEAAWHRCWTDSLYLTGLYRVPRHRSSPTWCRWCLYRFRRHLVPPLNHVYYIYVIIFSVCHLLLALNLTHTLHKLTYSALIVPYHNSAVPR